MFNLEGKIGGDAKLSDRGELYARKLPELVRQSVGVSLGLARLLSSHLLTCLGRSQTYGVDFYATTHHCNCSVPPQRLPATGVEGFG
jgi:hypothetical protein